MASIFISHVEEDQTLAIEIASGLEAAGFETWYYERDSEPGLSYLIQVHQAIEECAAVILVISANAIRSHQMTKEVVRAHDLGRPFVPVRFNISHAEFQARQPEWNIAIGAAASIPVPAAGASEIIPRIVRGLEVLVVAPAVSGTSAPTIAAASSNATEEIGPAVVDHPPSPLESLLDVVKRYRLALAGSAAVVIAVILFARWPEPPASGATPPAATAEAGTITGAAPAPVDTPAETAGSPERAPDPATAPKPAPVQPAKVAAAGATPAEGERPAARRTPPASPADNPVVAPAAPQPRVDEPVAAPVRAPVGVPERPAGVRATEDPPAPAAAPPAPAVTPPAIAPAALVKQAIAEYERAAEALDEEGVRRIWPDAPAALRVSYRNLISQAVDLDCAEPAVSGDTATVSCREQIRSVGVGRIALPVTTNTATFSLRRRGEAWEISRIARQQAR